jgi:branched-chain amino acid transport system substrate-binding protein
MSGVLSVFLLIVTYAAIANADVIPIGTVHSLTSWGAKGGVAELNGIRIAVDEINERGGILGKAIELHSEDNGSDLKKTVGALQSLISIHKIPILLGPNWAEFSEVAAPVVEGKRILMLSASGYTPELTKNRRFVFTTLPAHRYFTEPISKYILSKKPTKLAILTTGNAYCQSMSSALREQLVSGGLTPSMEQSFDPATYDYKSLLIRLKHQGYDAIYASLIQGGDMAAFLRQRRELHIDIPIYAGNTVTYEPAILADRSLADGVVFFDFKLNSSEEFLKTYRTRFGEEPTYASPRGYDLVYLVKDAAERCQSFDVEKLRPCISNTRYEGISDLIQFDERNEVKPFRSVAELFEGRQGKFEKIQ